MAIREKDRRNAILEKMPRYLWVDDVASASEYLLSLDPADIKNRKWLDNLIGYFEKKGDAITCYALRAKTWRQEFQQSCRKSKRFGRGTAAETQWNGLVPQWKRGACRLADDLPEPPV